MIAISSYSYLVFVSLILTFMLLIIDSNILLINMYM